MEPCVREDITIGDCRLLLGDCLEIMPTLGKVDAVITDPPYGINYNWRAKHSRKSGLNWGVKAKDKQSNWSKIVGDDIEFDPRPWLEFPQVILWGANNYREMPPARRWLVWDKRRETKSDNHGDAELAWTNIDGVIRVHRQLWRGIVREGDENVSKGPKFHPTQKPLRLMRWCVEMTTGTVCDPFMGSGTTLVACAKLGRKGIGIEIDEGYFDIACKRIREAYAQPDFFVERPAPPVQLELGP